MPDIQTLISHVWDVMYHFRKEVYKMQDFKVFDYIIDIDGIIKANKDGQNISVIINGEYYDFIPEKKTEKDGVKYEILRDNI